MAKTSRKKASKKSAKKARKVQKAKTSRAGKAKAGKKSSSKPSRRDRAGKKTARTKPSKAGARTAKAKARPMARPKSKGKIVAPKKSPARRGSALAIQGQHVDFLTYKVDQVRKFYEETLELRTESRDAEGLNHVVVATSEDSSLGFMPPHPQMRGEQPVPREPTLYFVVRDVDRAFAQLTAKGVAFMGPPQEMPWGHRVITTTDPEGRTVMLAGTTKKR